MKWTTVNARPKLVVPPASLFHRSMVCYGDKRMELRVQFGNSIEGVQR